MDYTNCTLFLPENPGGRNTSQLILLRQYYPYAHINIFIGENTYDNYSPCFSNWSHGRSWYFSITLSMIPLPLASSSSPGG